MLRHGRASVDSAQISHISLTIAQTRLSPVRAFALGVVTLLAAVPNVTYAAAAAIPQLAQMETLIGTLISVFCYIAFIVLVGLAAWEYMTTRRLGAVIGEVFGAVVVVMIAFNGTAIATAIGLAAASVNGQHVTPSLSAPIHVVAPHRIIAKN